MGWEWMGVRGSAIVLGLLHIQRIFGFCWGFSELQMANSSTKFKTNIATL